MRNSAASLPTYVPDRGGEMKTDATIGRMNDKIVMRLKAVPDGVRPSTFKD
jgi:hypothetical protein